METKRKIILSSAIFGVSLFFFTAFVILSLLNGIKSSSEELILRHNTLTELEKKMDSLKEAQIFYRDNQENLEKVDKLFFDSASPIDFIEFLEKEAKNSQLRIKISPQSFLSKKEGKSWSSLNFQLSLGGKFPDFLKFLEKLESASYLIEFSGLNIKRLEESDLRAKDFEGLSVGDVNAVLTIEVYAK